MDCRYIKHYSRSLEREMEYKTYGDTGVPVLVFPSQNGRFFDYENFGMIDTVARHIEDGKIRLICVDGIDWETWSNSSGDPRKRIERHEQWYHYITDELIPEVRRGEETFIATGCSMGGFHAATIFFRRPDFFNTLLSLSGVYSARYFMGNYFDGTVYDNSVTDFLSLMPDDHPYWNEYRKRRIICCVGQGKWEDDLLESTRCLDTILAQKNVPHWFDYWGFDCDHDWPWWRKQLDYFMNNIVATL